MQGRGSAPGRSGGGQGGGSRRHETGNGSTAAHDVRGERERPRGWRESGGGLAGASRAGVPATADPRHAGRPSRRVARRGQAEGRCRQAAVRSDGGGSAVATATVVTTATAVAAGWRRRPSRWRPRPPSAGRDATHGPAAADPLRRPPPPPEWRESPCGRPADRQPPGRQREAGGAWPSPGDVCPSAQPGIGVPGDEGWPWTPQHGGVTRPAQPQWARGGGDWASTDKLGAAAGPKWTGTRRRCLHPVQRC